MIFFQQLNIQQLYFPSFALVKSNKWANVGLSETFVIIHQQMSLCIMLDKLVLVLSLPIPPKPYGNSQGALKEIIEGFHILTLVFLHVQSSIFPSLSNVGVL